MTKTLIKKNIELSNEFDSYISKHPNAFRNIPKGARIVLTSSKDKELSESNVDIARNSRSGKFVEARKVGRTWKIGEFQRV